MMITGQDKRGVVKHGEGPRLASAAAERFKALRVASDLESLTVVELGPGDFVVAPTPLRSCLDLSVNLPRWGVRTDSATTLCIPPVVPNQLFERHASATMSSAADSSPASALSSSFVLFLVGMLHAPSGQHAIPASPS